jgi:predicted nuclease of restriction endonuclease-like (RecB) superfamily
MDESNGDLDQLYAKVAAILERARGAVARTVNTAMVEAYWQIGREIIEVEQAGSGRAEYGEQVIKKLAAKLGKGFSLSGLKRMRQFFSVFPNGSTIGSTLLSQFGIGSTALSPSAAERFPQSLAWSHYLVLMRIANDQARAFYEVEAAREAWSVRELERQIHAHLFERLSRSKTPEEVLALAREGQTIAQPSDVIKDPFVLEFLGLQERPHFQERDLEQAIIDRLETFLLEMGKGFCFVGRQRRLTIDGDHFYVDLVFYNRLLRCFVLVDLKLGKLTHQDLGQMMMYVNYYDRTQLAEHEAKTVGIVLCSEANQAMVKVTLPEDSSIMAATYRLYIPSEALLQAELTKERDAVEREFRLASERAEDE